MTRLPAAAAVLLAAVACTPPPADRALASPPPASPSAAASPAASLDPSPASRRGNGQPVTIAFGGDVHFEGAIRSRLADPATALAPIAPLLSRADVTMVNLETAVTARGERATKEFNFRAPASAYAALRAAGVDVVTVANNHGMDYGVTGLRDTLSAASAARFPVVGIGLDAAAAYRPWRTTVRGQRLAFFGATHVLDDSLAAAWTAGPGKPGLASAYAESRLLGAVRAARGDSDTVVVYLHWGQERAQCPIDRQLDIARKLVAAGADVVVGSHAHVLLAGGRYGDAFVDYGLGNFAFYARGGLGAQTGVLTLTVTGRAVDGYRWSPAVISGGVPRPLSGKAAATAVRQWEALRRCAPSVRG
jgi:poly-gamma-glutamate synthesis protein (capsule biosynthesis protein)